MLLIYSLALYVAVPIACLGMLLRSVREPQYRRGFASRFGLGGSLAGDTLWIHAASVGEVHAAESLVRSLLSAHPDMRLALTTMTPAGLERVRALFGTEVDARLIPFDLPGAAARFLRRVRPRAAVILETELWPNLYRACNHLGIPILIASARLSETSMHRYRRFAALGRALFAGDVRIAAQSEQDVRRFIAIGADPARTSVTGNLKYDFTLPSGVLDRGAELRARYAPGRPLWVAGSTHAGEEAQLLQSHRSVLATHPNAVLALAPRHRDRFAAVADWLERERMPFLRHSAGAAATQNANIVLVDTLGELLMFYAASDVSFVGGTLVPVGGHNLLEPAALARPVLIGPYYANTGEIARQLLAAGALEVIADAPSLTRSLLRVLGNSALRERAGAAGREVIEANRGALQKVLAVMEALLTDRNAAL